MKKAKFVSLLSGGLDSPISTYRMMKLGHSGVAITFLTANVQSEGDEIEQLEQVRRIAKHLVEITGQKLKLYAIPYDGTQDLYIKKINRKLTCLMCKRTMLRVASKLGRKWGLDFIINGDILGEQASQTMDNLYSVSQAIDDFPVIRPLIGFEKLTVIHEAQDIGTYDICSLKAPGCTKNPKYPETHAKLDEVISEEKKVDMDSIVEDLIESMFEVPLDQPINR